MKKITVIYSFLNKALRKRLWFFIIPITFLNSLLELLGLAMILPLLGILLSDDLSEIPFVGEMYTYSGIESSQNFSLCLIAFLFLFIVLKNLISLFIVKYQETFMNDVFKDISLKLFRIIGNRPFDYFVNTESHVVSRNIILIPRAFSSGVLKPATVVANELTILVLIIISLILYNATIFLILALIVVPFFISFFFLIRKRIFYLGNLLNDLVPLTNRPVYNLAHGYLDVKTNQVETSFFYIFKSPLVKEVQARIQLAIYNASPLKLIEVTLILAISAIIVITWKMGLTNAQVLELLGVLGIAVYRLMPSFNRILSSLVTIKSREYSIDVIQGILDSEQIDVPQKQLNFSKKIDISNIHFTYPNTEKIVLEDISFSIAKGDVIGIIGESGSGKTSMLNLLLRFVIENSGEIKVDGHKLGKENIESWRQLTGYVSQHNFIMEGSMAENIAFGVAHEDIDFDKMQECIQLSALEDFIKELPDGLNTEMGENGSILSGGQKQRIAIARALYNDAKILFFDEATSALDNQTEKEITNTVHLLKSKGYTIVIVAHRYSTLSPCDRILQLKQGRISREISYAELMALQVD